MNSKADTARLLLDTLRNLGQLEQAERLEDELEKKNWIVDDPVIRKLSLLIRTASTNEVQSSLAKELAHAEGSRKQQISVSPCLSLFAPFVETIPDYAALISAISNLGRAPTLDECLDTLKRVFVDALGFDSVNVDATSRLQTQQTMTRLVSVASYEGFIVSVGETSYSGPYATPYESVFRIHPYGLCVITSPEKGILRFAYTHGRNVNKREVAYRTLSGPPRGRDANDNLLTWVRRLHLVRPDFGDDKTKMRKRVEAAFSCTPADLGRRWPSHSFPGDKWLSNFGTPSWGGLPAAESRSFLQAEEEERLHWGLECVLRDRFPMSAARGRGKILYRGYSIESPVAGQIRNGVFGVEVVLKLELLEQDSNGSPLPLAETLSQGESESVTPDQTFLLPCIIPIADDDGFFWLDGVVYQLEPHLQANGSLATCLLGTGKDLLEDYMDTFAGEDCGDVESNMQVESETAVDEEWGEAEGITIGGASTRVLLEIAVSRKLAALSMRLWRLSREHYSGKGSVFSVFQGVSNLEGLVELYSKPFLAATLEPVDQASLQRPLRTVRGHPASGLPPVWACLVASAALHEGEWLPVMEARLHPCGDLAVPRKTSVGNEVEWVVAEGSAFDMEPQLGDTPGLIGRLGSAEHLRRWGHGTIADERVPAGLLRKGVSVTQESIFVSAHDPATSELWRRSVQDLSEMGLRCSCDCESESDKGCPTLLVNRDHLRRLERENAIRRAFVIDVPGGHGLSAPTVCDGVLHRHVRGGQSWLKVAGATWVGCDKPAFPRTVEMLGQLADWELPSSCITIKIPEGVEGLVEDIAVERIPGRYGQTVSWRARISIVRHPEYTHAVLPDGRYARILGLLIENSAYQVDTGTSQTTMLFSDGDRPQDRLREQSETVLFDGLSGECVEGFMMDGPVAWIPGLPDISSEPPQRFRLVDNEPVALSGSLSLSEAKRRWLRLAHPEIAQHVDGSLLRGREAAHGWFPALGALSVDLCLGALGGILPPECVVAGPKRVEANSERLTVPTRTQLSRFRSDGRGNLGGFFWQCECGTLTGPDRAEETCARCGETVLESVSGANRWTCECGGMVRSRDTRETCDECGRRLALEKLLRADLSRIHQPLPIAVLHPWLKGEAAALLGLVEEELSEVVRSHGPESVLAAASNALNRGPFAAISLRLSLEKEAGLSRLLGRALFRLRRWHDDGGPDLSIASVPVVPARFHFCGLPPGAPRLVHGGLVERYAALRLAIEQAEHLLGSSSGGLRISAMVAVQEAVDALYGKCDESSSGSVQSLASLVCRIWPLSRYSEVETAIPSLLRRKDVIGLQLPSQSAGGEDGSQMGERRSLQVLPSRGGRTFRPTSRDFWEARSALHLLTNSFLLPLAAVYSGLSDVQLDSTVTGQLEALGVEPADELATLGLRELLRCISLPGARPQALTDILATRLPLTLPSDPVEAEGKIRERLDHAIPSVDNGAEIAKVLLTFLLGGWWRSAVTANHPLGWRREPPGESLAGEWRRAVPTLGSKAWLLLTHSSWLLEPVRSLMGPPSQHPLVLNALGMSATIPRIPWWIPEDEGTPARSSQPTQNILAAPPPVPTRDVLDPPSTTVRHILQDAGKTSPAPSEATSNSRPTMRARVLTGTIWSWFADSESQYAPLPERKGKSRACSVCGHPPGMHHCCPNCRKPATGEPAIEMDFGFRSVTRADGRTYQVPQTWCRECRSAQRNQQLLSADEVEDVQ